MGTARWITFLALFPKQISFWGDRNTPSKDAHIPATTLQGIASITKERFEHAPREVQTRNLRSPGFRGLESGASTPSGAQIIVFLSCVPNIRRVAVALDDLGIENDILMGMKQLHGSYMVGFRSHSSWRDGALHGTKLPPGTSASNSCPLSSMHTSIDEELVLQGAASPPLVTSRDLPCPVVLHREQPSAFAPTPPSLPARASTAEREALLGSEAAPRVPSPASPRSATATAESSARRGARAAMPVRARARRAVCPLDSDARRPEERGPRRRRPRRSPPSARGPCSDAPPGDNTGPAHARTQTGHTNR